MLTPEDIAKYGKELVASKNCFGNTIYSTIEDDVKQYVPHNIAEALIQARKEHDELKECLALLGWKRTEQGTLEKLSQENKSPF